jgi:hypothetical protein
LKTLARILSGSRLYRLDNPNSDFDEKSIHLPDVKDCLLMRAARNIQRKEGEGAEKREYESFALTEFLALAARGEDVAITMLHCKREDMFETSPIWDKLWVNARRFYTKKMAGSAGFAKSQAAKYALRADRMDAVLKVIAALEIARDKGVAKLYQCWDDLPDGDHIVRTTSENNRDGVDKRIYEVAGKGLPATIAPQYGLDILCKLRDSYGERVKAARSLSGQDCKAMSHSFRVGYQLLHLFQDGTFSFPLLESDFIRAVKEGRANYVEDKLDEKLNDLIGQVEALSAASSFPDKVDQNWLDQIVLDAYAEEEQIAWFNRAASAKS